MLIKKTLLLTIFVVFIVSFVWDAFQQAREIESLSNIQTSKVRQIVIGGKLIQEPEAVHDIITALSDVQPYVLSNEGCYTPVFLTITSSNQHYILAVAQSRKRDVIIVQVLYNETPKCMYGSPLYSSSLAQVFRSLNITL
jgi:hypothetical protein